MKWFQHSTDSHDDPDISDAMDEFGDAGYSVFFILLELYGREFNSLNSEKWLSLSKRFVARKLRKSWTKVEQILNFYQERQRVFIKIEQNRISINVPQFIDIASNWIKRNKGVPTEVLQRDSVEPTAIEIEEEEKKNNIYRNCPQQAILDLYHAILPELTKHIKWNGTRAANLKARWNEDYVQKSTGFKSSQIEYWKELFEYIRGSDFLMGKKESSAGFKKFQMDLDWLVKSANFLKVIEGKYDNK